MPSRLFIVLLCALSLWLPFPGGVAAQDAAETETAQPDPRAATGGAQTREEIMARQRSLIDPKYRLTNEAPPQPAVDTSGKLATQGGYSDADIWRQIRSGTVSSSSSSTSSGQLMQVLGDDWRTIRRDYIVHYAFWIMLGMVGFLALFYLIRGQIKIRDGRAGTTIHRFSISYRVVHWLAACSFILMAISGLIILLGRAFIVEVFGQSFLVEMLGQDPGVVDGLKTFNAIITSAALQGHNLFGPVFIFALLILTFRFMRGNFFQWADIGWILKGGGIFGAHASCNHYNFGEKTWYWALVLVGLLMSATGLLLEFPWLTENLAWHQASTLLHAAGAIFLIIGAMGHIYIGTIGMEGALDSMLIGEVDENWAREHHDLWYEKVTGKSAGHEEDDHPAEPAVGETA